MAEIRDKLILDTSDAETALRRLGGTAETELGEAGEAADSFREKLSSVADAGDATGSGLGGAGSAAKGMGGMFLVAANQGVELAKSLVDAGKAAAEFAMKGEEAQRVAAGFTGDLDSLQRSSAGLVDNTTLQRLDQMAKGISETNDVLIDFDDVLAVATDRFAKGLGGSVAENAEKILKGEAEAFRELAIGVTEADARLQGLSESRKKAMMTQIAASEAESINLANIDQSTIALSQASVQWENLVSDLQVGAAEFLQTSGILDIVSDAVAGLTDWFGENKAMISDIATKGLKFLTRGFETLGPVIEIVADVVLVLADGLTDFLDVTTDIINFINPLADDFLGLGNETESYKDIVATTITENEGFAESLTGVANEAQEATDRITGLSHATLDLTKVDTAAVMADAAQAMDDFGGDAELLNKHLAATGDLALVQASAISEINTAASRRDQLQALVDEMERAKAVGDIDAFDKASAQIRAMGVEAGDAWFEIAQLNSQVAAFTDFLFKLGEPEPEKPLRRARREVTALDDAFKSLIASGQAASTALLLAPEQANLQAAGIGGLDDAGSALFSAFSANDDEGLLASVDAGLTSIEDRYTAAFESIAFEAEQAYERIAASMEANRRFALHSAGAVGNAFGSAFDNALNSGMSFRENMMSVLGELWGQLSAGFLAWATAEGNLLAGNPFGAIAAAVALGAIGSVISSIGSRGSGGGTGNTNAQRFNERERERREERPETELTVNLVGIPVPDKTARELADAIDRNLLLRGAA